MLGHIAVRGFAGWLFIALVAFCSAAKADGQPTTGLAAIDPVGPVLPSLASTEPFGRKAVLVTAGDLLAKWSTVEAEIRLQSEILARCNDDAKHCPAAARSFIAIIADGRARGGRARIGVINRAINLAIRPTSDLAQWGVQDRWSAPLDTLTTRRGDCEDYAIAKYVALRAAGVDARDVKLVIVRDLSAGEDHAVVAARLDRGWIILDNRRLALVADVEMVRVVPLFLLDEDGVKQFAPPVLPAERAAAPDLEATAVPGSLGF